MNQNNFSFIIIYYNNSNFFNLLNSISSNLSNVEIIISLPENTNFNTIKEFKIIYHSIDDNDAKIFNNLIYNCTNNLIILLKDNYIIKSFDFINTSINIFNYDHSIAVIGLNNGGLDEWSGEKKILNSQLKNKFMYTLWINFGPIIIKKNNLLFNENFIYHGYENDYCLKIYSNKYSVVLMKNNDILKIKSNLNNSINYYQDKILFNKLNNIDFHIKNFIDIKNTNINNDKLKIYCIFHDLLDFSLFNISNQNKKYLSFFFTGNNDIKDDYLNNLHDYQLIYEKYLPHYNLKYKEVNINTINYNKCYTALYHIIENKLDNFEYIGGLNFKFSFDDNNINQILNGPKNIIYYFETTKERNKPVPPDTWPRPFIKKYKNVKNVYLKIIRKCNKLLNTNYTYDQIMNWESRPYIRHGFTGCIIPKILFDRIKYFLRDNILNFGVYMERVYAILLIMCVDYEFKRIDIINHSKYFVNNLGYTKEKIISFNGISRY